jgi:hypothetical protein
MYSTQNIYIWFTRYSVININEPFPGTKIRVRLLLAIYISKKGYIN